MKTEQEFESPEQQQYTGIPNANYPINEGPLAPGSELVSGMTPYMVSSNNRMGSVDSISPPQVSAPADHSQIHQPHQNLTGHATMAPNLPAQPPIVQIPVSYNVGQIPPFQNHHTPPPPPLVHDPSQIVSPVDMNNPVNVMNINNLNKSIDLANNSVFDFGAQGMENYSWLFGTNFLLDMDTMASTIPINYANIETPGQPNNTTHKNLNSNNSNYNSNTNNGNNIAFHNKNNHHNTSLIDHRNILSRCEHRINARLQKSDASCEMDYLIGNTENAALRGIQPQAVPVHASVNVRAAFSQPTLETVEALSGQSVLLAQQNQHHLQNQNHLDQHSSQQNPPILLDSIQQPVEWNGPLEYPKNRITASLFPQQISEESITEKDKNNDNGTSNDNNNINDTNDHNYNINTDNQQTKIPGSAHTTIDERKYVEIVKTLEYIPALVDKTALFTSNKLAEYLELFWNYFDVVYPVIHKATFTASLAEPELLIAMVTIGMAYGASDQVYQLAIEIHRKFRNMLLVKVDDQPQVPLWVHQSLLLTNYFVKLLGSRNQHAMSEMFHGTSIALLKLSGYLSDLKEPTPTALLSSDQGDCDTLDDALLSQYWSEWTEYECRKRITYFAFICDTQHATLFRHTQGLSAFDINLEMPCTDACWAASTPKSFWRLYKCQPRHVQTRPPPHQQDELSQYLWESLSGKRAAAGGASSSGNVGGVGSDTNNSVDGNGKEKVVLTSRIRGEGSWPSLLFSIRRLMSPYRESQKEYHLDCFSQFGRLILLHGLLSVCWDSQWRGLLDMGIVSKRRMSDFRVRLVQAISSWREYFDRQLRALNTPDFNLLLSNNGERTCQNSSGLNNVARAASGVRSRHDGNNTKNTNGDRLNYYGNSPLLCANWSLYNFSLVALYADTLSQQTFAECMSTYSPYSNTGTNANISNVSNAANTNDNSSISLDPSSSLARQQAVARSLEQLKAQKVVYAWAATEDAKWAVWHCAHFLTKALSNNALLSQADHVPWCVYLATLCMWSYEVAQAAQSSQDELSSTPYITQVEGKGQASGPSLSPYSGLSNFNPSFIVNKEKSREDALEYLAIVQRIAPRSAQTTPSASDGMLHNSSQNPNSQQQPQSSNSSAFPKSIVTSERQMFVMALVAYVYVMLEQYDRGVVINAKPLLYGLLDRYSQK